MIKNDRWLSEKKRQRIAVIIQKHTVDANKVCSYWSEKTKMFTFQMSEQELIVILREDWGPDGSRILEL